MSKFILNKKIDFELHNEQVEKLWNDFRNGNPDRVPITFSMNARMIILNPELNRWKYSWKDFFENPDVRWEVELNFQKWLRFNVLQDSPMGYPKKEWNGINISYQNCDEGMYFGCPIVYPENDMPFLLPILKEDKKRLYKINLPDVFENPFYKIALEHYYYLEEKREKSEFENIPVGKTTIFSGTDGPLTVACNLRGANQLMIDFYEDPQYVYDLLSFITEETIRRIKKVYQFLGIVYPQQSWGFADDSIELISTEMYKKFVMPYHIKLLNEFSKGGPNSIHICGKVQRHLKTLKQELNIKTFDLGYPVDLGKARQELGEDVLLIGNISPILLKNGPCEKIREEVKKLCNSGVMKGKKFILHDGNNCAPQTPVLHFETMYEAGKEFGKYN
ncbi:MAG: uroporphyrinogen decarboxylase family protein [Candidatus Omnitrophica bacterium]|nr:uroporphyrinogen decarboxylase family protein [Candidatus Omnitrophota bacterium]